MYKGLSIGDFSKKVLQVKASAEKWPNMQVLFFVDESNSTSFMGHLKELLVDHRWNNEPLPSNVFIVAAINPQEIDRAHGPLNVTQSRVDFSKNLNVQTGARAVSAFDVRPPHPSMEELYYYFTEMDEPAVDDFWESIIKLGASEIDEDERRTVIEYGEQVKNGNFPKPISLGARAVGFIESEGDQWIDDRTQASRGTGKRNAN